MWKPDDMMSSKPPTTQQPREQKLCWQEPTLATLRGGWETKAGNSGLSVLKADSPQPYTALTPQTVSVNFLRPQALKHTTSYTRHNSKYVSPIIGQGFPDAWFVTLWESCAGRDYGFRTYMIQGVWLEEL